MTKYINVEKLKTEIERLKEETSIGICEYDKGEENGRIEVLTSLQSTIDSLQQEQLPGIEKHGVPGRDFIPVEWVDACEKFGKWKIIKQEQPEDVVLAANTLLEALSKTPYNNKPITDAQIIVKQLLLFFDSPVSYNPDAINQEQLKVDLNESIKEFLLNNSEFLVMHDSKVVVQKLARHFYELGLNSRKGEIDI